ncbi:MAG TPA: 30S ribosome-binding factor RbfA [Planctomycetota bacterium]|nr:30S ribosome-binding factor RbfA [Planctomycetota bacterium]
MNGEPGGAMTHYRKDRLQSEIVKETSQILLYELKDPRKGFVTVTRAKVSDDYRTAKIFVSVMGTAKQKKLTMSGLRHAQGFVQAELSRRIKMRVFPEIRFELDESIDQAFRIAAIFDKLEEERARRGGPAPAAEEEE